MKYIDTILIIDDNFEDRFILRRYLQKTDLKLLIIEASSGEEGLELLTTPLEKLSMKYPDISVPVMLFLDINMPMMDGWQFVEEMERRHEDIQLNPTVVMMYSTSDDDEDKSKAMNYEAVRNYIVKGESSPESLREAILNSWQAI